MAKKPTSRRSGSKPVRPPVIDLDAEVIEPDPQPASKASPDNRPKAQATPKAAKASPSGSKQDEKKADAKETKPAASNTADTSKVDQEEKKSDAGNKAGSGASATPPGSPPPLKEPQEKSGGNGFWIGATMLASILAAGGGGALLYQQYMAQQSSGDFTAEIAALRQANEANQQTISRLRSELEAVRTQTAELATRSAEAAANADNSEDVSRLQTTIDALNKRIAETETADSSLRNGLAQLRDALSNAAANTPPDTSGDVNALTRRMDNLSKSVLQLSSQLDAVRTSAIEAEAETANTPQSVSGGVDAPEDARIARLTKRVNNLAKSLLQTSALLDTVRTDTSGKTDEVTTKTLTEVTGKQTELTERQTEIVGRQTELSGKQTELSDKQTELARTQTELSAKQSELAASLAEVSGKLSGIATRLAAVGADTSALAKLKPQVDAILALPGKVEELEKKPVTQVAPPVGQAFAKLSARIIAGKPFSDELDEVHALFPDAPGIDDLRPLATTGVATVEQLRTDLAALSTLLDKPLIEDKPDADDSVLAGLKARLLANVKIRKAGETDWAGLARRAHEQSSLDAGIALLEDAANPPEALASWLKRAKNRQAAEKAEKALSEAVVAKMASQSDS